jgi:ATP-dependent DNA ligase
VAFDALQTDGHSLLTRPYTERRAVLESLFADHRLSPPWTLCSMTTDPGLAREWLEEWTQVPGLEGIVTKPLSSPYKPGPGAGSHCVGRRPPKPWSAV